MEPRAAALLTEAVQRFPEHEPLWVHLMVAKIRLEDCAGARRLGDEAAVKFPDSAPVHAFHGVAAACVGDIEAARSALERSLQLNPDQDTLRNTLAQLPGPSTPNPQRPDPCRAWRVGVLAGKGRTPVERGVDERDSGGKSRRVYTKNRSHESSRASSTRSRTLSGRL